MRKSKKARRARKVTKTSKTAETSAGMEPTHPALLLPSILSKQTLFVVQVNASKEEIV